MDLENQVKIKQNEKEIDRLRVNVSDLMAAKVRFEGEIKALIDVMTEVKESIRHLDKTLIENLPRNKSHPWTTVIAAIVGGIFTLAATIYTGLIDLIVKIK